MIKIDLLPPDLKKKESFFSRVDLSAFSLQKLPVLGIIIVIAMAVVAIQAIVFLTGIAGSMRSKELAKKYEALMPALKEAEELKARADDITRRSSAIDELVSRRFAWAKLLNNLSDSVTDGIWLKELVYDERPGRDISARAQASSGKMPGSLAIAGYAAASGEQGTALVGKFIKSLKDNIEFYSNFSDIKLVSAKSDRVSNQEVMNFRIVCDFKQT
jgi:Tfp pilus assembly protein PilN